jgi:hypothetical protein
MGRMRKRARFGSKYGKEFRLGSMYLLAGGRRSRTIQDFMRIVHK